MARFLRWVMRRWLALSALLPLYFSHVDFRHCQGVPCIMLCLSKRITTVLWYQLSWTKWILLILACVALGYASCASDSVFPNVGLNPRPRTHNNARRVHAHTLKRENTWEKRELLDWFCILVYKWIYFIPIVFLLNRTKARIIPHVILRMRTFWKVLRNPLNSILVLHLSTLF